MTTLLIVAVAIVAYVALISFLGHCMAVGGN